MLAVVIPNISVDEKRDEDRILGVLTLPTSCLVCFRVFQRKREKKLQKSKATSVFCRARCFAQISIFRIVFNNPLSPHSHPSPQTKQTYLENAANAPYQRIFPAQPTQAKQFPEGESTVRLTSPIYISHIPMPAVDMTLVTLPASKLMGFGVLYSLFRSFAIDRYDTYEATNWILTF